jgi:glycine oxidase
MSGQRFDVGIIGGGVIGLSCAWRLARAGARVALFERGEIGREASWAAAGMLAAQCEAAHHPPSENGTIEYSKRAAMFDLCLQSRAMYADFADEIGDVELDLSTARSATYFRGITYAATSGDDVAISAFEKQHSNGLSVAFIDKVFSPNVHFVRAFLLPDEGSVNSRKLVQSLKRAAIRAQVSVCENVEVRNVQTDDFGARINTSEGTFRCEKVLMCAGSWSGYVPTPLAQILRHVQPVGGQIIALKYPLGQVLYSSGVYLVPRRDGSLLVGATVEAPGFRHEVRRNATVAGTLQLLNAACQLLPDLKDAPILDQWAGLRPGTPDGLPILGSTPIKNLYVATGHYRNGILLAPITAKLMTDCILNGVEPPREFSIERFQNEKAGA